MHAILLGAGRCNEGMRVQLNKRRCKDFCQIMMSRTPFDFGNGS